MQPQFFKSRAGSYGNIVRKLLEETTALRFWLPQDDGQNQKGFIGHGWACMTGIWWVGRSQRCCWCPVMHRKAHDNKVTGSKASVELGLKRSPWLCRGTSKRLRYGQHTRGLEATSNPGQGMSSWLFLAVVNVEVKSSTIQRFFYVELHVPSQRECLSDEHTWGRGHLYSPFRWTCWWNLGTMSTLRIMTLNEQWGALARIFYF